MFVTGTPLPSNERYAGIVPHGNGLVVVGGATPKGNSDALYRYDTEAKQWVLLPERLEAATSGVTAFTVAREAFGKTEV